MKQSRLSLFIDGCKTAIVFMGPIATGVGFMLNSFLTGFGTPVGLLLFLAGEVTLLVYFIILLSNAIYHFTSPVIQS